MTPMKDTELYGQLLGPTTPWTVSKVELRLTQGAVVRTPAGAAHAGLAKAAISNARRGRDMRRRVGQGG